MPGGKCPPIWMGATKPGPYSGEFWSVTSGLESTSRWVMVDWLMKPMLREVNGAWSLAKKAAVRASATAPSMAKVRVAGLLVIAGETLPSTRTPRRRPPRSTMATMPSPWPSAAEALEQLADLSCIQLRRRRGRPVGWRRRRPRRPARRPPCPRTSPRRTGSGPTPPSACPGRRRVEGVASGPADQRGRPRAGDHLVGAAAAVDRGGAAARADHLGAAAGMDHRRL